MVPAAAAAARAAAALARAAARGQGALPDDEPLHTTAARLLRGLALDQALARGQLADGRRAGSDLGEPPHAETVASQREGASPFERFVAKGVTWVDLETHFGGDPDHLPLLRKLTQQVKPPGRSSLPTNALPKGSGCCA